MYKDRPGYAVQGTRLRAVILPEDGGKLASVKHGDRELLAQAPGREYLRLGRNSDYVSSECSGFDDMFPTIDPYIPTAGGDRGKAYLDHGEVCRVSMDTVVEEKRICLRTTLREFPVEFQKTVSVTDSGAVALEYTLKNRGDRPFPCLWAAHCMLKADPMGTIVYPFSESAPVRPMFGKLISRNQTQPCTPEGESYKYYFTQPVSQGYCGYRYGDGSTLMLRYPGQMVPYLGVWINNGSFKGMYNIALEPCTAPYDRPDAAAQAGCGCEIPANGEISFCLTLDLEERTDGNG